MAPATATSPAVASILEIEIDGPRNDNCIFRPLQRRIRGAFDLRRVAEPKAMEHHKKHPDVIPGQRLRLDVAAKRAELIETLRLPGNEKIRERYEFDGRGGKAKEIPQDEVFENVDVATWLYFMAAEVKAGTAKITQGNLPDKIEGKIQRSPYVAPVEKREDSILAALNLNTQVLTELLKRLVPTAPAK